MALLPTTGRIKATDCCRMPGQPLHIFSASKIGRLTNFEQTVRLGEGSLLISFVFREEDIQFFCSVLFILFRRMQKYKLCAKASRSNSDYFKHSWIWFFEALFIFPEKCLKLSRHDYLKPIHQTKSIWWLINTTPTAAWSHKIHSQMHLRAY